jgi:hypothetical protein
MLVKLNDLVLMRIVLPSMANTVQRGLLAILDAQTRRAREQPHGWQSEGLFEHCRRDPSLLPLLEPVLTDEVFQWLMGTVTDNADEQT